MSRACANAAEPLQTSSASIKTNCEIDFLVFIEFGRERKDCGLILITLQVLLRTSGIRLKTVCATARFHESDGLARKVLKSFSWPVLESFSALSAPSAPSASSALNISHDKL